jgi:sugar (pentulose or hexulose) kinase
VAATVTGRDVIEPVPEWTDVYQEQRARFQALYPALKPEVAPCP